MTFLTLDQGLILGLVDVNKEIDYLFAIWQLKGRLNAFKSNSSSLDLALWEESDQEHE